MQERHGQSGERPVSGSRATPGCRTGASLLRGETESWDCSSWRRAGSGSGARGGNLLAIHKNAKRGCKEDEARPFPVVPSVHPSLGSLA